jgi:RNA-binding protein
MESAMTPPTSSKKRSLMPSSQLRRRLRGHGHALAALVQVGKAGVTRGLVQQLTQILLDHELVKVKVAGECPADRFEVADRLGAEPGVDVVQILGRTILLYKRHPQTPRYEGPRAAATDAAAAGGGPKAGAVVAPELVAPAKPRVKRPRARSPMRQGDQNRAPRRRSGPAAARRSP